MGVKECFGDFRWKLALTDALQALVQSELLVLAERSFWGYSVVYFNPSTYFSICAEMQAGFSGRMSSHVGHD